MDLGQTTASPDEAAPVRPLALAIVAVSAFGLAFCMSALFLGMRGVLDLGGFVAYGGPYEIAHPAPDWVWVFPVSIISGFAFGGLNAGAAWRAGGFNLLPAAWAGLFGALGWNFFEYGFRPPGGGEWAWGWILCGVVFWGMALPSIAAMVLGRGFMVNLGVSAALGRVERSRRFRTWYLILNVAAIVGGVVVGTVAFRAVAG